MHSFLSRANVVFAYTLTVLAAVTFGCFASTFFFKRVDPMIELNVNKQIVKSVRDFTVAKDYTDLGFLTFDVNTDLNPLFNWNVKQLFLYITAEYKTENNEINQVILWDKIILRGEKAVLDLANMNTKYYFFDDGIGGLRSNKNISLTFSWNTIPNAGLLPRYTSKHVHQFAFPDSYTYKRSI
eukprot:Seg1880.1 transcript_id=Seg1880.1/GoldUCD/mRNA.D3Y31 product="Signal peptidase complex subunit 3" protein_id=Seg1880.1/GoldUCD/D3Y31